MIEITHTNVEAITPALPIPDAPIIVRLGTMADIGEIDALQKMNSKALGFFPRAQLEGYINNGWVLVAEERVGSGQLLVDSKGEDAPSSLPTNHYPLPTSSRILGYVASRDRYLKRDELGAVFQLCVRPGHQRKLIGATLLKAVFERAAYGTKLYCCWCAQDLKANYFWEAMGFVPLAVRAGSSKKSRTHIFWQKRIRSGDEQTAWWYPSGTDGGAIREGRVVLPIPPGVHWTEARAMAVVAEVASGECGVASEDVKLIEEKKHGRAARGTGEERKHGRAARGTGKMEELKPKEEIILTGVLRFAAPTPVATATDKPEKPKRAKREKVKVDPQIAAKARELRDRWMDAVNSGQAQVALPVAKYDVGRQLGGATDVKMIAA